MNMNGGTRTHDNPKGDRTVAKELPGNEGMAVALYLFWACLKFGVFVSFEHPLTSRVWRLPFFLFVAMYLRCQSSILNNVLGPSAPAIGTLRMGTRAP